jgi:predicted metal-dependent hydrolase
MLVTVVVFAQVLRGTKFLVHEDPSLPSLGYLRLLWKLRTSVKLGSIPGVRYLLRSAARMLRRDYNPVDEASTAQAIAYLAASPAARAYG